jgi:hypothetical protein
MAQYQMVAQDSVTFAIDYTPNNGHVTDFTCVNNSDQGVTGYATLTNSQVFSQVFPAHTPTPTPVNIPNNLVTISFDARGEVTWTGLASFNTV